MLAVDWENFTVPDAKSDCVATWTLYLAAPATRFQENTGFVVAVADCAGELSTGAAGAALAGTAPRPSVAARLATVASTPAEILRFMPIPASPGFAAQPSAIGQKCHSGVADVA